MEVKFNVVIPAAGRGSRSGLNYPKCLYRINGTPIIILIMQKLSVYDVHPVVIINEKDKDLFAAIFREFTIIPRVVFQNEPKGMGDAILKADELIPDHEHVILVWSDIPYLQASTIEKTIDCHLFHQNDFSLVTSPCKDCYTVLVRKNGKVVSLSESREEKDKQQAGGERDIGFFVFRKKIVFDALRIKHEKAIGKTTGEHGFLYIIEQLVNSGHVVQGYPVAVKEDLLSFNTPEDLAEIILGQGN